MWKTDTTERSAAQGKIFEEWQRRWDKYGGWIRTFQCMNEDSLADLSLKDEDSWNALKTMMTTIRKTKKRRKKNLELLRDASTIWSDPSVLTRYSGEIWVKWFLLDLLLSHSLKVSRSSVSADTTPVYFVVQPK